MKEINNIQEYEQLLESKHPILLDFYADWCSKCQALMPIVDKLATKHASDFVVAKVNIEKNVALSKKFSVRNIPALVFVKNGEIMDSLIGVQTETVIDDKIHQYL